MSGHCVVASRLAQDYLGGDVVRGSLKAFTQYAPTRWHYWNRLPDGDVDFTASQFTDLTIENLVSEPRTREEDFKHEDVLRRYTLLKERFEQKVRDITPIQIVEPTPEVLAKADFYIELVKKLVPGSVVTLVGSLAIPVCVKNEIDILVEVGPDEDIRLLQEKVRDGSNDIFGVGPIADGEGYSRSKKKHGIICELHFLPRGHVRAERYKRLVEFFKSNPELTQRYNEFKRALNGLTQKQYKEEKAKFFVAHVPRDLHAYS